MLICTQSGRVSGLEKKTDPAIRGSRKTTIDCWVSLTSFVSLFDSKSNILIFGVLDSDCTLVTLHRIANFRNKHLNSGIEQTQWGKKLKASKRSELRKKSGGTYKRENLLTLEKRRFD